jgi:hypothetical protein
VKSTMLTRRWHHARGRRSLQQQAPGAAGRPVTLEGLSNACEVPKPACRAHRWLAGESEPREITAILQRRTTECCVRFKTRLEFIIR